MACLALQSVNIVLARRSQQSVHPCNLSISYNMLFQRGLCHLHIYKQELDKNVKNAEILHNNPNDPCLEVYTLPKLNQISYFFNPKHRKHRGLQSGKSITSIWACMKILWCFKVGQKGYTKCWNTIQQS